MRNDTMETVNAKIDSTMLGVEDHGIMTCMIGLDYGGSHQGFGGYSFDGPKGRKSKTGDRIGTAFGCEFIRRVLEVVGVETWEQLKGKHVRVKREGGWNGSIVSIGNIIKDDWFDPKELANSMKDAS
jgi:hypothetical protein